MKKEEGFPIEIVKGADFQFPIYWQDPFGVVINISGYTAKMQVRISPDSEGDPLVEGAISINGAMGLIFIVINNSTTETLPVGDFFYDVFVTSPSTVKTRLFSGTASIVERVTK